MVFNDDAYIWQDAITLIGKGFSSFEAGNSSKARLVDAIVKQARFAISNRIQQQYRHSVSDQRWISSRLSLLTAELQNALDETQIYEILAQHLPVMDIQMAYIALFELDGSDPVAWSVIRNAIAPAQAVVRFRSYEFPPDRLAFACDEPFQLVMIPLVDQTGQLGYVVFGIDSFDLYGAIVQQLGGALNTARLYRQATEGRRLAEEANQMKSRFLSTISHELRTPLNLIVGLSGIVLHDSDDSDKPLPEPARKDIERIHAYSQHLGGLIGDVIDLATSDAGQLRLNNELIDLGKALRIIAESGSQLAADKGLSWEAQLPETGPWIWGDKTRLRQVALNLINNAIKFTSVGGIRLRLVENGNFVTVMVSDTGLGISPEEQNIIFDEFRQSERSLSRGYGGLGLGLAISKRLVEMHGGTISVSSSGVEGEGAVFSFHLPLTQPPLVKPAPEITTASEKQTIVILANRPSTSKRLAEEFKSPRIHCAIHAGLPGIGLAVTIGCVAP